MDKKDQSLLLIVVSVTEIKYDSIINRLYTDGWKVKKSNVDLDLIFYQGIPHIAAGFLSLCFSLLCDKF